MIGIQISILFIILFFIFKFRSLLLKLVITVAFLPLMTMTAFINGLPVPGVLGMYADNFNDNVLRAAYFLLVIVNFIIIGILFPLRKKVYEYKPFICTNTSYVILLCIMLFSAIISYPRVFGIDVGIDLSTIYISSNISLLMCKKTRKSWCSILHLLILLFVLIGGDRVDSIVAIVFMCIMGEQDDFIKESIKKKYIVIGGGMLFLVAVISGILRDGNSISIPTLLFSIYAQQTVTDVLYVFICGVGYFYENGIDLSVLGNLFFGLFPGPFYGAVSNFNYTIFLSKNFLPNPGGGLFYTEGMIAFGPIGVIVYTLIYSFIMKTLFERKDKLSTAIFILFMVMLCRTQWYGFIYSYKPIIFTTIFYFIFIHNINKQKDK